ncbi:hypothetical protein IV498_10190 [Paenarthrobacter sp. Z7-10]|nr:hypothetical protein [Paenarthrobacter sp. Z7-10]
MATWLHAPLAYDFFRFLRWPRGQGTRIDIEVWRVQARIGHTPRTPLVTFELVRGQDREIWSIRSMETIAA